MEISYSEAFLIVWASVMTILYVITRHEAEHFKRHTLYKLKQVHDGNAKIVCGEDFIAIKMNGEE